MRKLIIILCLVLIPALVCATALVRSITTDIVQPVTSDLSSEPETATPASAGDYLTIQGDQITIQGDKLIW